MGVLQHANQAPSPGMVDSVGCPVRITLCLVIKRRRFSSIRVDWPPAFVRLTLRSQESLLINDVLGLFVTSQSQEDGLTKLIFEVIIARLARWATFLS